MGIELLTLAVSTALHQITPGVGMGGGKCNHQAKCVIHNVTRPPSLPSQVHPSGPLLLLIPRGLRPPPGRGEGGLVWIPSVSTARHVEDDAQHRWLVCIEMRNDKTSLPHSSFLFLFFYVSVSQMGVHVPLGVLRGTTRGYLRENGI